MSGQETEKAAAVRELIRTASSLFWHRHEHGNEVEYSLTVVGPDGKRHTADGQVPLLHLLLEAVGVMLTKWCSRCKANRPLVDFSGDGADRWCLICRRERAVEYRESKRGVLKHCSRCGQDRRGKDFHKGQRWCKKCKAYYNQRRYQYVKAKAAGAGPSLQGR